MVPEFERPVEKLLLLLLLRLGATTVLVLVREVVEPTDERVVAPLAIELREDVPDTEDLRPEVVAADDLSEVDVVLLRSVVPLAEERLLYLVEEPLLLKDEELYLPVLLPTLEE